MACSGDLHAEHAAGWGLARALACYTPLDHTAPDEWEFANATVTCVASSAIMTQM